MKTTTFNGDQEADFNRLCSSGQSCLAAGEGNCDT